MNIDFNLNTLKFPISGSDVFTKGYGFTDVANDAAGLFGLMVITLVEK
jgi:hypothetical protein